MDSLDLVIMKMTNKTAIVITDNKISFTVMVNDLYSTVICKLFAGTSPITWFSFLFWSPGSSVG